MGKTKKNKSNHDKQTNVNKLLGPSVSILTITQLKRFECLEILIELIKSQTYKNIIEWVIMEGSRSDTDADTNKKQICEFIEKRGIELDFAIVYIERTSTKNIKLGELRNIGNISCKGDITVCMDDDDYYFSDRIEHAVKKLVSSNCKIAGCSNHLMYDYDLKMLVQMKQLSPTHSINSCMAWKKEYLLSNSHDPEKEFGEEQSFTKNFTEPMVCLDPFSTVIISSHSSNTFNKKKFFICVANEIPSTIEKKIEEPISKFIPNNILEKYNNIFKSKTDTSDVCEYDIVYVCGTFSFPWDPTDLKLGGSEQAVVNLSENWVKIGKSVIVYGEVPDKIVNGVIYKPFHYFNYNKKYKNIILWRSFGIIQTIPLGLKADMILFDVHDNFRDQVLNVMKKNYTKANKIMLKSNYHKEYFLDKVDNRLDNQDNLIIIPNGIRINNFNLCPDGITRNPYRFCYCSDYTRGLDKIITILWPIIYNYEPRAELHVYYGMNGIKDENAKAYFRNLLALPGIMDHGRQPVDIICREKYMSSFHFYITKSEAEIDCINIRESLITGCIPLISNFGVFKERQGIHFDFNDEKDYKMAAIGIINLLKNPHRIEELRKSFYQDETITTWEQTALEWNKYFV
jgi:glycosyltransferase involved in cell wall biosynthesis